MRNFPLLSFFMFIRMLVSTVATAVALEPLACHVIINVIPVYASPDSVSTITSSSDPSGE